MQQGIAKGDVLQRLGSLSFIVGAIVLVVFNALFPRATDPANTQQVLTKFADNETLAKLDALLLAVGIWAFMIGMTGVYRSITTGAAATWTRLGYYGVIVGTTMWTAVFALSIGTAGAAAEWKAAAGAGQTTAYSVAASLNAAGMALFSMTIIVYWLALSFVGIGMTLSTVYPKWAGWAAIVLGAATVVVVGIVMALSGTSQTLQLLFTILSILSTLWALVVGIWIARKAW